MIVQYLTAYISVGWRWVRDRKGVGELTVCMPVLSNSPCVLVCVASLCSRAVFLCSYDSRWLLRQFQHQQQVVNANVTFDCFQLVAEFQRLGSVIIYGNFNRLILCTKKRRLIDALSYVEYISNSIRSRQLFHLIDLCYDQCWEILLWLDPVSYSSMQKCVHMCAEVKCTLRKVPVADTSLSQP